MFPNPAIEIDALPIKVAEVMETGYHFRLTEYERRGEQSIVIIFDHDTNVTYTVHVAGDEMVSYWALQAAKHSKDTSPFPHGFWPYLSGFTVHITPK